MTVGRLLSQMSVVSLCFCHRLDTSHRLGGLGLPRQLVAVAPLVQRCYGNGMQDLQAWLTLDQCPHSR
jgi:hypothetical protein